MQPNADLSGFTTESTLWFGADGGTASIFVSAADEVVWAAALSPDVADWLAITSGSRGQGCGLVTLTALRSTSAQRSARCEVRTSAGRGLMACPVTQGSALPLAALNDVALAVPFPTTPRVIELGIVGNFLAQQIQKIPEPFDLLALAIVEIVIEALGALAIVLRAMLSVAVPEPLTWFGAPLPYGLLTSTLPATAVFLTEETQLLAAYVAENAAGSE